MHSHVMVMTFEGEQEAQSVYYALQRMRGSPLLGLENAAAVSKDGRGKLAIYQKKELSPDGEGPDRDLVSPAIALLFGDPPDEMVQELVKGGFDDRFREQVAQALGDNCSALLILVTSDSAVDRSRLRGILTLFRGRIFETTLPMEAEAALAQDWEA